MRSVFIGSKNLGLDALKVIYKISPKSLKAVITIDDNEDIRCKYPEFEEFSNTTGIKLYVLQHHSQLYDIVYTIKPDFCLVVGWYWIIEEKILKIPQKGFVGIHASLLPKYRGGAPLIWPIIKGDSESGVSLFYFNEGMDSGEIIAQKSFKISEND